MQGNELGLIEDEPPVQSGELEADAARDLTDKIRTGLETIYQLIKTAYHGRAWKALGYGSWDEYITREFGNLHLRPPKEKQSDVVLSLHDSGMSLRAISTATQLSYGTVRRRENEGKARRLRESAQEASDLDGPLEGSGDPNGSPEPSISRGQDGKLYRSRRIAPSVPNAVDETGDATAKQADELSLEDVLNMPATDAGIVPLDLEERAGQGRERATRMLREFHGSGAAALPMTIKLASQVAGLVSPVTGKAEVPDEDLNTLAGDVAQGLRMLSHVLTTLVGSLAGGESASEMEANLRESVGDLDRVLLQIGKAQ